MRVTQYTDFSLRVLIYLGVAGDQLSTIQEISDSYGISRNHLMKVVQQLAREGYVESIRGQGGGLRLKRPPDEIRLGQLIRDMEPDLGLVECFRPGNQCVITPICTLPNMLNNALMAFICELDEYSLGDLLTDNVKPDLAQLLNVEKITDVNLSNG
ncbi:MAG: Rrf2 family transcriptional regulator [Pseudomonadales bacterium]|nr:Rrf2 family transcriptional regulator [Pseudomonadales bacterium]